MPDRLIVMFIAFNTYSCIAFHFVIGYGVYRNDHQRTLCLCQKDPES